MNDPHKQSRKVPSALVQIPGEMWPEFNGWCQQHGYRLVLVLSWPEPDWYVLSKIEPVDDDERPVW